jgi:hypothetical protein
MVLDFVVELGWKKSAENLLSQQNDVCSFLKEHNMNIHDFNGKWTLEYQGVNDLWIYNPQYTGRGIVEID